MNFKTLIAIALMAVGLIFISGAFGLQVISQPDSPASYSISETSPGGTASAPTEVESGKDVALRLSLTTTDTSYLSLVVKATIAAYPYDRNFQSKEVTLTYKSASSVNFVANSKLVLYEGSWSVPFSTEKHEYKVSWMVIKGDVGYAQRKTYFVGVAADTQVAGIPDGDFRINGRTVGTDTNIVTNDGKLTFTFTPTENASNIGSVYIEVWDGGSKVSTVQLIKSSETYSASYQLPGHGYYTIKGFIKPSGDSVPVQTLSIYTGGSGDDGGADEYYPLIGVPLVAAGSIILFIDHKPRKKGGRKR